jgi:two-component system, NtrC family, response regulator AlgB
VDLEEKLAESVPETDLLTESPKMRQVLDVITRVAASDASVLLRGESGTGKGVLARALHSQSARAGHPFIMVNCPTLSEDLLASELFGHARGAFTGAVRDQPGRVEAAAGGTLFLDEVSEIAPGLQAKLLRFLQEKEFERVGENQTRRADVRVVAATNRDLEQAVQRGQFREDLLFRLNVVEVRIPPLRERQEDILPLAKHFLAFFARATRKPVMELSAASEALLLSYPWPGNIRELRNAIERATILGPARIVEPTAFPERIAAQSEAGPSLGGNCSIERIEREHIHRVVSRTKTQEEAAEILGIDASTLWRKRKKYESD